MGLINIGLLIAIVVISIYLFSKYLNNNKQNNVDYYIDENVYDVDYIVEYVAKEIDEIVRNNLHQYNLSKEEYERRLKNRIEIKKAIKSASYGDINSKKYVKALIKDILLKKYSERDIDKIINFNNAEELSVQDKFDIILYQYKEKYDLEALSKIINDYDLDEPKTNDDGVSFEILHDDIKAVYDDMTFDLSYENKIDIIVQRIYQKYKGFGVIDEIRDMKIDGVSGGVSGIPVSKKRKVIETLKRPYVYENVWVFYKGKQIRLAFLSFGSEKELIRVCKNIYRYNNPGQLSESNGHKVNDMYDGSRVVVGRPPFAESWFFFVRKLDSGALMTMNELVVDDNKELPISTIKWLIKGNRTFAVTGSQGTGKTTMLMAIIKYINPSFTLRIQEMAFELNLRNIYPTRNILSFRETNEISGQEGLNLQKKTDGTVNILGEVADAKVASWMIQMSQVASLFTLFTHHAKTTSDLVTSIRNNLLQTGVFSNEIIAEKQVAETISFDIHLARDVKGHRYIERITEIIPLSTYSEYDKSYKEQGSYEEKQGAFLDTTAEYYSRVTDRKVFETRDIVVWDNHKYVIKNKISEKMKEEILNNLMEDDKKYFLELDVV